MSQIGQMQTTVRLANGTIQAIPYLHPIILAFVKQVAKKPDEQPLSINKLGEMCESSSIEWPEFVSRVTEVLQNITQLLHAVDPTEYDVAKLRHRQSLSMKTEEQLQDMCAELQVTTVTSTDAMIDGILTATEHQSPISFSRTQFRSKLWMITTKLSLRS